MKNDLKALICRFMLLALTLVIPGLMTVSCGGGDSFTVRGKLADKRSINIRYVYYDSRANVLKTGLTASREGEFSFTGSAQDPTVVEITDNDYRPLAMIYAVNGDEITCDITPGNPRATVSSGNDITARWSGFLTPLASASAASLDSAIIAYAATHPDDELSALLLLADYSESSGASASRADLLASLGEKALAPSVKMSFMTVSHTLDSVAMSGKMMPVPYLVPGDSVMTFNPSRTPLNLIAVSSELPRSSLYLIKDSLTRIRRALPESKLAVLELSVSGEQIPWMADARTDTVTWTRGMAAGGLSIPGLAPLMITRTPFYVLADSTGRQIYRGNSLAEVYSRISSQP